MTRITRYDPLRSLFARPSWFDEFEDSHQQRGLKIHETGKDIVVEAVVAGVPAENVEVDIEDGVLTIKAEKKDEIKKKDSFKSSSFQYYYTAALSGGAWNKAKAETDHGVLTVSIPKAAAARPQKIKVKTKASK